MTDIRLVQTATLEAITLDWLLTPTGALDLDNELATAVTVALLTDARAKPDDTLPNPDSDDRRGWWADLEAETIWNGWPIGSRLWLMAREKITDSAARQGSTVARIETYIREALHPFIDQRIASKMTVAVQRNGLGRIDADVTLFRGPLRAVELRFAGLWADIG